MSDVTWSCVSCAIVTKLLSSSGRSDGSAAHVRSSVQEPSTWGSWCGGLTGKQIGILGVSRWGVSVTRHSLPSAEHAKGDGLPVYVSPDVAGELATCNARCTLKQACVVGTQDAAKLDV